MLSTHMLFESNYVLNLSEETMGKCGLWLFKDTSMKTFHVPFPLSSSPPLSIQLTMYFLEFLFQYIWIPHHLQISPTTLNDFEMLSSCNAIKFGFMLHTQLKSSFKCRSLRNLQIQQLFIPFCHHSYPFHLLCSSSLSDYYIIVKKGFSVHEKEAMEKVQFCY